MRWPDIDVRHLPSLAVYLLFLVRFRRGRVSSPARAAVFRAGPRRLGAAGGGAWGVWGGRASDDACDERARMCK